jgi:hypothetical protein
MGFKDEAVYTDAPQPCGELFIMRYDGITSIPLQVLSNFARARRDGRVGLPHLARRREAAEGKPQHNSRCN